MKSCVKCGATKALSDFYIRKDTGKRTGVCRACRREHQAKLNAKYKKDDPAALKKMVRNCHLKRTFGITLADYDRMFARQKGRCAICLKKQTETKRRFHVDHSHSTGIVRGLLCFNCNSSLGKFKDSPGLLENAIRYLERHSWV